MFVEIFGFLVIQFKKFQFLELKIVKSLVFKVKIRQNFGFFKKLSKF